MSFPATVVSVMIASPGDVHDARQATYEALNKWNDANARNRGIMLLPLRWETSATPETGPHPQDVINNQLVDRADIVIALFGSRMGAATPKARSGTVEEIEGAHAAGKPVHVYFSNAPIPNDVEVKQLAELRAFKEEFQKRGLYGSFTTADELGMLVWQVIEKDLVQLGVGAATAAPAPGEALDVTVEVIGDVHAYVIDSSELSEHIERTAAELKDQVDVPSRSSSLSFLGGPSMADRRDPDAFVAAVDAWSAGALEHPSVGLHSLAAQISGAISLHVINKTKTSLKEVRVEVSFDVPLVALDWEAPGGDVVLYPERPKDWGRDSYLIPDMGALYSVRGMKVPSGSIRIEREYPATLVVEIRRLHSEQTIATPDDEVVLVYFGDDVDALPETVTATFRITAGDIHDVVTETLRIPVRRADWREPLRAVLSDPVTESEQDSVGG